MDLHLDGKRAIVTGASRGIGRAIAQALLDEGVNVAIGARDKVRIDDAVGSLSPRPGRTIHGDAVDVGDGTSYIEWLRSTIDRLGGLDILVLNPSGGISDGEQGWHTTYEIDMMGFVRGFQAALPALRESGAASVVITSSTAAIESFGDPTSYGPIKAAIIAHASGLARHYAPEGIRVNCVCPGPVEFPGGAWAGLRESEPEFYEANRSLIPLGRMATAEEIAKVTVFVASPAASFMTGSNVLVDGGFTRRVDF